MTYFNPRSHERSDLYHLHHLHLQQISIHAPTRGATQQKHTIYFSDKFQSTLPREERPLCLIIISFIRAFQSTLPREERLYTFDQYLDLFTISIHAPTRGATGTDGTSSTLNGISIHAPTRGATCHALCKSYALHISIHAPTRGATRTVIHHGIDVLYFNPRSHERSDARYSKIEI